MPISAKSLAAKLRRLGSDSEEIAEYFRRKGITGNPSESCECPMANWLKTSLRGNVKQVKIKEDTAEVRFTENVPGPGPRPVKRQKTVTCELPKACAAFVEFFDDGLFPDLIA